MMRSFLSVFAAVLVFAAPAAAQPRPRPFATINFGFQSQSQDLNQRGEFPLYDETATFEAVHKLEGGPFFELGGGVGVMKNVSVGASWVHRSKAHRDVQVTARVPSPIFTDTFRDATGTVSALEHSERAFHLQAIWHVPVTVEFDVNLFGGPSFFSVKDELIESVSPSEVGGDFSQVDLPTIVRSRQSNSSTGFNIGIDTNYMFGRSFGVLRNAGVGAMLRYTHGGATLTSPTGGDNLKTDTGGLEIAGGLRLRF